MLALRVREMGAERLNDSTVAYATIVLSTRKCPVCGRIYIPKSGAYGGTKSVYQTQLALGTPGRRGRACALGTCERARRTGVAFALSVRRFTETWRRSYALPL